MYRLLVLENDSLPADFIVSDLTLETAPDVLRRTYCDSHKANNQIREYGFLFIRIEEPGSNEELIPSNDLSRQCGFFRVISRLNNADWEVTG